jgi:hypothetical protein
MGTMDEFSVDPTAQTYLDDYNDDKVQAAVSFCHDALGSEAARNDKFKRKEVISLAFDEFELDIYQLALVEEYV